MILYSRGPKMLNEELFDYVYDRLLLKPITKSTLAAHSISTISCHFINNVKAIQISHNHIITIYNNSNHITAKYVLTLEKLTPKEICEQLLSIDRLIRYDMVAPIAASIISSIHLSSCSTTNYSIPLSLL